MDATCFLKKKSWCTKINVESRRMFDQPEMSYTKWSDLMSKNIRRWVRVSAISLMQRATSWCTKINVESRHIRPNSDKQYWVIILDEQEYTTIRESECDQFCKGMLMQSGILSDQTWWARIYDDDSQEKLMQLTTVVVVVRRTIWIILST